MQLVQQVAPEQLATAVCVLGNSQMDIYYGELDIPALYQEIMQYITHAGVGEEAAYTAWLQQAGGYRELTLSDGSRWILLQGIEPGKYIHIHPARYSLHSLRVKATTLKTAIACLVYYPGNKAPDLEALNEVRKTVLQLSPVKGTAQCHHLWKVMAMLQGITA